MSTREGGLLPTTGTRIPIAWLSLVHRKSRLFASLGGVAFASLLMFLEMGFRNGLFDSQAYVAKMMNADLVIVHSQKEAVVPRLSFSRRRLVQARGVAGVVRAYPLYIDEYRSSFKNSTDGREYPLLVYGMNPDDPVFMIPDVQRLAPALKEPDTAIIDSKSRNFYGRLESNTPAELSRRKIRIIGTFALGPDFRTDGNLIVSDRTFFNTFGQPGDVANEAAHVEFGLLKVAADRDVRTVQRAVIAALPSDVRVLTKDEFVGLIVNFWGTSKPVGYVFGLGMAVGFLIGVTICYQILYTDILDTLPQFATLKAIGYHNRQLVRIVLAKAMYLGVLGFIPGLAISLAMYAFLQAYSGIRMELTVLRTLLVLLATVAMCLVAAGIAIRRVIHSDPAEVFE
jgi:putative ABC transport system permease protein